MNNRHVVLMKVADVVWADRGRERGWELPPPATWIMRHGTFRDLRTLWHFIRLERHMRYCRRHCEQIPDQRREYWVIYAISRGWC